MMTKPLAILLILLTTGLALGGCSRCGWAWDDWRSPAACRGDLPKS